MINLTLTDEQAEILGYALTEAWRYERAKADIARKGSDYKASRREREHRIEELRDMLDAAPRHDRSSSEVYVDPSAPPGQRFKIRPV